MENIVTHLAIWRVATCVKTGNLTLAHMFVSKKKKHFFLNLCVVQRKLYNVVVVVL